MGKGAYGAFVTRRAVLSSVTALFLQACSRNVHDPEETTEEDEVIVNDPSVRKISDEGVSAFARALTAGEVRSIRLIGDSITAGWGCDGYVDPDGRAIYDGSYGYYLEPQKTVACWANDFRAFANERGVEEFTNASIPGAKMRWLAEDPGAWVASGADAIFVMLGANDAVYSTREEFAHDAEVGMAAAAEACRLLVVIAPPTNDRLDSVNLYGPEVLEEVLRELCERRGWPFVSLLDAIELGTDDFNADQCHPTSKGSHKLWERLRAELGL